MTGHRKCRPGIAVVRAASIGVALLVAPVAAAECRLFDAGGRCIEEASNLLAAKRGGVPLAVGATLKRDDDGVRVGRVYLFRPPPPAVAGGAMLEAAESLVRADAAGGSLDNFGYASVFADFDGDGYPDLVVGIPGASRAGLTERPGVLNLFTGAPGGFVYRQVLTKPSWTGPGGLPGLFGSALAVGDFRGNGLPELAAGSPGHPVAGVPQGSVVLYRRLPQLSATGQLLIFNGIVNLPEEDGDSVARFGSSLTVGDLDGDGYDDLVVGAPGVTVDGVANAGAVFVFRGRPAGPLVLWQRIDLETLRQPIISGDFGSAVAVGDFNGNGRPGLAIGAPGGFSVADGAAQLPGRVYILHATRRGLALDRVLDQAGLDVEAPGDLFGLALAAGDFNGDGFDDLAVGAPGKVTAVGSDPNIVDLSRMVLPRYKAWVLGESQPRMTLNAIPTPDAILDHCLDGQSLPGSPLREAGADRLPGPPTPPGPGIPDLAALDCQVLLPEIGKGQIGPFPRRTGRVFVFHGAADGLEPAVRLGGGAPWPEEEDSRIGYSLTAGDLDGDGFDDLAVGAPGKPPEPGGVKAGVVQVFRGGADGLAYAGELRQAPLTPDGSGDRFGEGLSR